MPSHSLILAIDWPDTYIDWSIWFAISNLQSFTVPLSCLWMGLGNHKSNVRNIVTVPNTGYGWSCSSYVYVYKKMGVHVLDLIIRDWWILRNVRSINKLCQNSGPKPIWSAHCSQKNETMEAPHNRIFCFDVYSSSPWAHLYRWKCQSIWAKREVLIWRTCWGTHCELGKHCGNSLGT